MESERPPQQPGPRPGSRRGHFHPGGAAHITTDPPSAWVPSPGRHSGLAIPPSDCTLTGSFLGAGRPWCCPRGCSLWSCAGRERKATRQGVGSGRTGARQDGRCRPGGARGARGQVGRRGARRGAGQVRVQPPGSRGPSPAPARPAQLRERVRVPHGGRRGAGCGCRERTRVRAPSQPPGEGWRRGGEA